MRSESLVTISRSVLCLGRLTPQLKAAHKVPATIREMLGKHQSYAAEGEGLHPLASQAFMNYRSNLLGKGKVNIRDIYAIIARHLPPDDPTYLSSLSAEELEEMASRDVGWEPRPIAFDAMSLDEALQTAMPAGAQKTVAQNTSGVPVAEVAI